MEASHRFKIVLLGEGRVGKTSILLRYINGEYNDSQNSTICASYLDKHLQVGNENVHLAIWDTAGQERFHALAPIYYRDTDGALLVYDVTDSQSFAKAQAWAKELRRMVGSNVIIAMAGNKVDLVTQRQVSEEEAESYAATIAATHHLTSAKKNLGLGNAFEALARRILQKRKDEQEQRLHERTRRTPRQKLIIVEEQKENKTCC